MFFHRFVRVGGRLVRSQVAAAFEPDRYTIVPLFRPDTTVGQALLDDQECAILSAYAACEDSLVDIVYLGAANASDYDRFVQAVFDAMGPAIDVKPRDPCLLIAEPSSVRFHALTFLTDQDWAGFKRTVFDLIERLSQTPANVDLSPLMRNRRLKHFVSEHGGTVWRVFKEAAKLFLRPRDK
jgi:hypothetical protein